jgi:hypothetical protein
MRPSGKPVFIALLALALVSTAALGEPTPTPQPQATPQQIPAPLHTDGAVSRRYQIIRHVTGVPHGTPRATSKPSATPTR